MHDLRLLLINNMCRMSLTPKSWLLILFCLICAGLLFEVILFRVYRTDTGGWTTVAPLRSSSSMNLISNGSGDRIWKKVELEKALFSLPKWGGVHVDFVGNIYTWDYDYTLRKFSSDGKFLQKYGKGRGSGPSEFRSPQDVAISDNFDVWVCDGATGLVTVFSTNGSLQKTVRLKTMPYRIRPFAGNRFVIQKAVAPDALFEVYDIQGNVVLQFGSDIIADQSRYPVVTTGTMDSDGQRVYFTFYYVGRLVCFNIEDGSIVYSVETKDRVPAPAIQTKGSGEQPWMRISPDAPVASLGLRVEDGKVLIRSGVSIREREKKPYTVIDTYSASNGTYLYSYRFPARGFFSRGFFYEDGDTTVTKWSVTYK
jgi:hypothetical protein